MIKHLAYRFFRWFCYPDYFDEIQGDLEEIYQRNMERGKQVAQWKYFLQVLVLFRPTLIRSFVGYRTFATARTNPAESLRAE